MMLGKKFSVACISLLMVLALAGCGKTGESEAEKLVKEACKIPDSYKKVDYQVDDKNGIAYLDFKAKNMLGMEIPGRAYFKITKEIPIVEKVPFSSARKYALTKFEKGSYAVGACEFITDKKDFNIISLH